VTAVGLVTYWFNGGQGMVMRRLRDVLDELGHETFVLARPTRETFHRPAYIERSDAWDRPGVTEASAFDIPMEDYECWVAATGVEAVVCFQNYGFAELRRLRERGVRTYGTFMWETFGPEHAAGARDAYDVVFALTQAGARRFAELGVDSTYVPWGCHPDDARAAPRLAREDNAVVFYVPGGYLSRRKPVPEILDVFAAIADPRLRLVVKVQGAHRGATSVDELRGLAARDGRVAIVEADLPARAHAALFAACDVCLAPSRWEGLGLHLYEALAIGMPVITTAAPPMDEAVTDGVEGALVACRPGETTRSGIHSVEPDPEALRETIVRLADDDVRKRLADGALEAASGHLAWKRTKQAFAALFPG